MPTLLLTDASKKANEKKNVKEKDSEMSVRSSQLAGNTHIVARSSLGLKKKKEEDTNECDQKTQTLTHPLS